MLNPGALTRLLSSASTRGSSARLFATVAFRHARANVAPATSIHIARRFVTDNITYSGGQAMEGQGGFYGSGGARAVEGDDDADLKAKEQEARSKMLALAADVEKIQQVMDEYETLESLLAAEESDISNKSIELKGAIKKLMTAPDVLNALDRLEIDGGPVWGLSTAEREMILMAREVVNEC